MADIVEKFGGTSMAQPQITLERLEQDDPSIVVVSAPGKDIGREDCEQSSLGQEKMTDLLSEGRLDDAIMRAEEVARRANIGSNRVWRLLSSMSRWIEDYPENPAAHEAAGERFSAELVEMTTGRELLDPRSLIAINSGKNPQLDASMDNLRQAIKPTRKYVLPGYYGYNFRNPSEVQVLQRGGSDTSGAIVAAALGVEYHNLTDVDGFHTTDPRFSRDARPVKSLSYSQARALALGGASLLHPDVAHILDAAGLPTIVRDTFSLSSRGTHIGTKTPDAQGEFVAVAARPVFALDVRSVGIDEQVGIMRGLYDALAESGIPYLTSNDGPDETTITIGKSAVKSADQLLELAKGSNPDAEISVNEFGLVVAALSGKQPYGHSVGRLALATYHADGTVVPLGNRLGASISLLTDPEKREQVEQAVHNLITA